MLTVSDLREKARAKVQRKRAKLAAKRQKAKDKIKSKRGTEMKKLIVIAAAAALSGCGTLERVDPAARSARASYTFGNIQADNGSTVKITLGDGAMAAADGDGAVSQPTTTTTSVPTTWQTGGLDPVTCGISAIANLASKGIDAYAANPKAAATPKVADCPDGGCQLKQ